MRGFLLVTGALVAGVALLFAIALLDEAAEPSAVEALPEGMLAGAEVSGDAARAAVDAWAAALPPARLPLTVDYELRGVLGGPQAPRADLDLHLAFGRTGGLRMDLVVRTGGAGGEPLVQFDGSLVFVHDGFWAWGELPAHPELRQYTEGRVVRLPQEMLELILAEGVLLLDAASGNAVAGEATDRGLSLAEILRPAGFARLLVGQASVVALRLEGDELQLTTRGAGPVVESLLAQRFAPEAGAAIASLPARLTFDVASGLLLAAELAAPAGVEPGAGLTLRAVRRQDAAPEELFRPPEGHQVFDLEPLLRPLLPALREARSRGF